MKWKNECIDQIEDNHLKGMLLLSRVGFLYDNLLMKALKPYDVSVEQFNILSILRSSYPNIMNLKRIQFNLVNQTKNTTRLVEKLKTKALISSAYNTKNRRELDIVITQKGIQVLEDFDKPFKDLLDKIKELLSEEDMGNVTHSLINLLKLDENED